MGDDPREALQVKRGEEWALTSILIKARSLAMLASGLRKLSLRALPEELVLEYSGILGRLEIELRTLHEHLREDVVAYREARNTGDVEEGGT